jgi:hypothetical protein
LLSESIMVLDTVIFGGGSAGLWLLDELARRGSTALLLEASALGGGQTVASQGIIHGGLKYTLNGLLSGSAKSIREMPLVWKECLAGRREPSLAGTRVRARACHLWRTDSISSRIGMFGARVGLRIAPESIDDADRTKILKVGHLAAKFHRRSLGAKPRPDSSVRRPLRSSLRARRTRKTLSDPSDGSRLKENTRRLSEARRLHGRSRQRAAQKARGADDRSDAAAPAAYGSCAW